MRKAVAAIAGLLVLAGIVLAVLARSALTGDAVRAAVESQVSSALGQPVHIGALTASIYPRVTMTLNDVTIGQPPRIQLDKMHLGTDLRALFSRRIEHADVRVDRARVTLPLPALVIGSGGGAGGGKPPVEIVSVDEVVLHGVEIASGDRRLRGDIDLVPRGAGVQIRHATLTAEDTSIELTGALTSLAPLAGRVEATTPTVNLDRLMAFLGDFAAAAASPQEAAGRTTPGSNEPSTFVLSAGKATAGALALTDLKTTAVVTPGALTFEPASFGIFGGRYDGAIALALGGTPRVRFRAKVTGIDTSALMAFAGSPNTISGTLTGAITLESSGLEIDKALRAARGSARVDIVNGSIAGLSLLRTVVLATSGRGGYGTSAATAVASSGDKAEAEKFSHLGATLALANGVITTNDFAMTSTDADLTAGGTVRVATMTTDMHGQVRLSEALSQKGGTDLYRYAQENGRVTLPATVTGPLSNLSVQIDLAKATERALKNRATEELNKAIERNLPGGLGGLFKKPKG